VPERALSPKKERHVGIEIAGRTLLERLIEDGRGPLEPYAPSRNQSDVKSQWMS